MTKNDNLPNDIKGEANEAPMTEKRLDSVTGGRARPPAPENCCRVCKSTNVVRSKEDSWNRKIVCNDCGFIYIYAD